MFGQSREVCNFGCANLKLQLMLLTKDKLLGKIMDDVNLYFNHIAKNPFKGSRVATFRSQ